MSFVRFGKNSDVYVFGSKDALECCGCILYDGSFCCKTYSRMLDHLREHSRKGDDVPKHAFDSLLGAQAEEGNRYSMATKRRLKLPRRLTKDERNQRRLWKLTEHIRKRVTKELMTIFVKLYRRRPVQLEIPGLAECADVRLDLSFGILE